MAQMDRRPGNQIKPVEPEPEYAKRRIEVRGETDGSGKRLMIDLMVCTRCGSYVWDLQAHENWHREVTR